MASNMHGFKTSQVLLSLSGKTAEVGSLSGVLVRSTGLPFTVTATVRDLYVSVPAILAILHGLQPYA